MLKNLSILFIMLFSFFLFSESAEAKVLPQTKSVKQTTVIKNSTGSGISVTPRLRSDKRALVVNFANLQNAKAVSYALTYSTSQQQEGAMGAIQLSGAPSTSQELLFGTCSKSVCRYHVGVSNAKLEVSYTSKSGKKYLKRYKIRV